MDTRVIPAPGYPGAVILAVGDTTQSTIDLTDPTNLIDEYTQHLAFLVDAAAPAGEPLRVLHLGAGGLALARYVAATRPRSYQQAVEIDPAVVDLVRAQLPLNKGVKVKIRVGDAREVLAQAPEDCYQLIIADLFSGPSVPAHVTTVEFMAEVARVLRPGGFFAANVCDGRGLTFSRSMAAALAKVFPDHCVMLEPGVRNGRRFGNVLLFGALGTLPITTLARRAAGANFPYRVLHDKEFRQFLGGASPAIDATAVPSPTPPPRLFER